MVCVVTSELCQAGPKFCWYFSVRNIYRCLEMGKFNLWWKVQFECFLLTARPLLAAFRYGLCRVGMWKAQSQIFGVKSEVTFCLCLDSLEASESRKAAQNDGKFPSFLKGETFVGKCSTMMGMKSNDHWLWPGREQSLLWKSLMLLTLITGGQKGRRKEDTWDDKEKQRWQHFTLVGTALCCCHAVLALGQQERYHHWEAGMLSS